MDATNTCVPMCPKIREGGNRCNQRTTIPCAMTHQRSHEPKHHAFRASGWGLLPYVGDFRSKRGRKTRSHKVRAWSTFVPALQMPRGNRSVNSLTVRFADERRWQFVNFARHSAGLSCRNSSDSLYVSLFSAFCRHRIRFRHGLVASVMHIDSPLAR